MSPEVALEERIVAVMKELGKGAYPVGFDIAGSPFADLPGETSAYIFGYDDFKLSMFCDGYIFWKPLSQYEGVTPIQGFINEKDIEYARQQTPNPKFRNASPDDFYFSALKTANIQWKYRKFE